MLRVKMSKGGADPDATSGTGVSTPMQQPETQLPDPSASPDGASSGGDPNASPDGGDPNASPDGGDSGQKIPQANAGYQGPDQGPFICANCIFFDNGHCEVVDGTIDHLGCCNNFSSLSGSQGGQGGPPQAPPSGGNTIGDPSNSTIQSATDTPPQPLANMDGV